MVEQNQRNFSAGQNRMISGTSTSKIVQIQGIGLLSYLRPCLRCLYNPPVANVKHEQEVRPSVKRSFRDVPLISPGRVPSQESLRPPYLQQTTTHLRSSHLSCNLYWSNQVRR
ncbi:hypothetical protein MPTK1_5g15670 [Marchantia polymorpha subsp. ruderalis]|uniref:Uncharacterized protein n=2 Tax=Marchantia polymorpha TaxID=3197 RepID=A0AAF6BIQ9_MARPO|nr:hypothetical protein MARPO_0071s0043 [Marchantia polymorpha]BBN11893.1 hypothetical protein Mp_5g15670 [Marchantia polymorpha subsp. ruderalis]|eukprot:PTQ35427.1 hypothetical protein MARPO_0071s0043 [Marchantia polymorpha]